MKDSAKFITELQNSNFEKMYKQFISMKYELTLGQFLRAAKLRVEKFA